MPVEPEIVDLCNMLIKMGANIDGLGSHRIQIEGVDRLKGCHHRVISDRIETATYIIAAVITNGKIRIEDADLQHLGAFVEVMNQCGVELEENTKTNISVKVSSSGLQPFEIITLPYPGFPTDLQAQMTALASVVPGLSILTERVYPSRFMHVPELLRMGAEISLEGSSAIVQGVKMLKGAPVMASDLRASAALILAGLAAQDETWVQRIYHLDRGYDKFDSKLQSLGAEVERLSEDSLPKSFYSLFRFNIMNDKFVKGEGTEETPLGTGADLDAALRPPSFSDFTGQGQNLGKITSNGWRCFQT